MFSGRGRAPSALQRGRGDAYRQGDAGRVTDLVGRDAGRVTDLVGRDAGRVTDLVGRDAGRVTDLVGRDAGRVAEPVGRVRRARAGAGCRPGSIIRSADISRVPYERLPHVLWIAGPAGAGKTTVARRLARRHGLRWYNCDAQTWQHLDRAVAAGVPNAQRFAALTPAQRAVARPEEIGYDRGPLTVDDLHALPHSPTIVVDGAPPDPAVVVAGQAVWLLPSQAVQRARLERRHPQGVPHRYLQQWQEVAGRAAASRDPRVTVDDLTVDQTIAEVERVFARRLAEGPRATTVAQRRELLRHANRAVIAQCRGWLAHQPDRAVRPPAQTFDCECARPACTALVELPVEVAESATVAGPPAIVAAGHRSDIACVAAPVWSKSLDGRSSG